MLRPDGQSGEKGPPPGRLDRRRGALRADASSAELEALGADFPGGPPGTHSSEAGGS